MNNQNSTRYGYVNKNGRLVPTDQQTRERVIYNAGYEQPQRVTQQPKKQPVQQPKKSYAEKHVEEVHKKNENKKKGKGIKNFCAYLALFMILSSAKQMPFNVNGKVTEVAARNANHNYMDDVFAGDETIKIVNPKNGKTQKIQLEEAVNRLEDYLEVTRLINDLDIEETEYVELTDKEKKEAIKLYEEKGIEGVVSLYKNNKGNTIERARTARQLIFIKEYFGGDYIEQNGMMIAREILTKTIQTGAIENYGTFGPLEYGVVSIPQENEFPYFGVNINDPVSGATDRVVFTPIACGEYAQAVLLQRKLNQVDDSKLSEEERQQIIEHTLRVVKKCLNKEVKDFEGITYTKKVK